MKRSDGDIVCINPKAQVGLLYTTVAAGTEIRFQRDGHYCP